MAGGAGNPVEGGAWRDLISAPRCVTGGPGAAGGSAVRSAHSGDTAAEAGAGWGGGSSSARQPHTRTRACTDNLWAPCINSVNKANSICTRLARAAGDGGSAAGLYCDELTIMSACRPSCIAF